MQSLKVSHGLKVFENRALIPSCHALDLFSQTKGIKIHFFFNPETGMKLTFYSFYNPSPRNIYKIKSLGLNEVLHKSHELSSQKLQS